MDDTRCRKFFSRPRNPYHRRYEALRAVFVEGRSQKDVAGQFAFEHGTLRHLVREFREHCRNPSEASPFFANLTSDGRPPPRRRAGRGQSRTRSRTLRIARS